MLFLAAHQLLRLEFYLLVLFVVSVAIGVQNFESTATLTFCWPISGSDLLSLLPYAAQTVVLGFYSVGNICSVFPTDSGWHLHPRTLRTFLLQLMSSSMELLSWLPIRDWESKVRSFVLFPLWFSINRREHWSYRRTICFKSFSSPSDFKYLFFPFALGKFTYWSTSDPKMEIWQGTLWFHVPISMVHSLTLSVGNGLWSSDFDWYLGSISVIICSPILPIYIFLPQRSFVSFLADLFCSNWM